MALRKKLMILCEMFLRIHMKSINILNLIISCKVIFDGHGCVL